MEYNPPKKPRLGEIDSEFANLHTYELRNGVSCFILHRPDFKDIPGSISLVVKAGRLNETKDEAGVAHLLEHVLVRAAAANEEAFGLSRRRLHENHLSALDRTIFSFRVSQRQEYESAIQFFGSIADRKVVITEDHMKLESGIVAMEYNEQLLQDPLKSNAENLLGLIVEGTSTTKMCLDNLNSITCPMVNEFYQKWYLSNQMALIIITGSFNSKDLLDLAQRSFCGEKPTMTIPECPRYRGWSPEIIQFEDDITPSTLALKLERSSNLIERWSLRMVVNAAHRRLDEHGWASKMDAGTTTFIFLQCAKDVEKVLVECCRLRKFGLLPSEFEREKNAVMKDLTHEASLFCLSKDKQIATLQGIIEDFLFELPIHSPHSLTQLAENSLSNIDCSRFLDMDQAKIYWNGKYTKLSHDSFESLMRAVEDPAIAKWEDPVDLINFDEALVSESGCDIQMTHLKEIDMYEGILINGMRVLLCRSDTKNECSMKGFAYGGLSEVDEENYFSSYFAVEVVKHIPSVFNTKLVGREDLKLELDVQDYMRTFEASFDTSQLNVALQLVFLLFHKKPNPARRELMKALEKLNDEMIPLSRRVYKFASGPSFLHQYPKVADLDHVNGAVAIKFFSESFLDPSQFTVVIAGDFDVDMTAKLVKKYLGSIPRGSSNIFPLDRCGLKTFPIDFPENSVRCGIYRDQEVVEVFICVPLKMDREKQDEDEYLIGILSRMVEQKLLNVLRNEMGEVYSLSTKAFFDGKMYASPGCEEAILVVNFVHKGTLDWELVDKSLNVIEDLQINVSEADIACALPSHAEAVEFVESIKRRSLGVLQAVLNGYQAKQYKGDLQKTLLERWNMIKGFSASRDLQFWKNAFLRIMPLKCTQRHVSVGFHYSGKHHEDQSTGTEEEDESDSSSDEEDESDSSSDEDGSDSDEDEDENEDEDGSRSDSGEDGEDY